MAPASTSWVRTGARLDSPEFSARDKIIVVRLRTYMLMYIHEHIASPQVQSMFARMAPQAPHKDAETVPEVPLALLEQGAGEMDFGERMAHSQNRIDGARKASVTHGMSRDRAEYRIWKGIKQRCFNPRRREYPRYGGCGISMHAQWADSFAAFIEYIGPRPSPAHSIDRIDNERGYEPGNVRWATPVEQARNSRSSRNLEWRGKTQNLTDWGRELGLARCSITARLRKGWSIERALSSPPRSKHNKPHESLKPAHK